MSDATLLFQFFSDCTRAIRLVFQNVGHLPSAECPLAEGTAIPVPLDGAWHHCAVVSDVDSGAVHIYVDGTVAATEVYAFMRPFLLSAVNVGFWPWL